MHTKMYAEPVSSVGTVTLREDWGPLAGMGDIGEAAPLPATRELGPAASSALDTSKIPVWKKVYMLR